MATLAVWLQETYSFSSGNAKLLMIFVGLVAVAMVVLAIAVIALAIKVAGTIKELSATALDVKTKLMPLLESVTEVSHTSQELLRENAPKVKAITDNLVKTSDLLVETSMVVRGSAQQFDKTITDVNLRTQHQVARIDGMVTTVLSTTSEIVETIDHGIRAPAQKIAGMASQLRYGIEGIIAKIKARAAGPPSGNGNF
jgi:methyl-accepting chemotaxis protein